MNKKLIIALQCAAALYLTAPANAANPNNFSDTTHAYSMPLFVGLASNKVGLSWTETDASGIKHLYWAVSADQGKTYSDKKLIYASTGLSSSRLMRAKVLAKKDGSLVAIFGLNPPTVAPKADAHAGHDHANHGAKTETAPAKPARGGRPSDLQIVYSESKDGGNTWSAPQTVHQDKTPKIIRGFYDSALMSNDEIAVAFLKDTGKPHERDLRIITSENGKFGEERVIDPFVCDCCNVSLLTDNTGKLNIYYRSNIKNIRDIAHMVSADHGKTFSKPAIVLNDKWEINGCPHSGPVSASGNAGNLVSWFSATPDSPGVRVATQQGKKLFVLKPEASNPFLASNGKNTLMLWEEAETSGDRSVVLQTIGEKQTKQGESKKVSTGTNPTGIASGNTLWIASEVPGQGSKKSIQLTAVKL